MECTNVHVHVFQCIRTCACTYIHVQYVHVHIHVFALFCGDMYGCLSTSKNIFNKGETRLREGI